MSIPPVTQSDIDQLQLEYPTLDFDDFERQAVLFAPGSVDVQAAPGSGKTTLLAAKLSIMAKNWPYEKRGICVVSHTNVAREEIEFRLKESRHGSRLFSHPHFIGTIQSFIHTFISLPLLRSSGVRVRVIDDDEHARIAARRIESNGLLRALAARKPYQYAPAFRTLRYIGPSLELSCAEGVLPGATAQSYRHIEKLKVDLSSDGIFRYDDMFAFAQHALSKFPTLREALAHRFPLVFVDEMQDTSDAQVQLLESAMGENCIYQRFGDVNQRILRVGDVAAAAFPVGSPLPISSSKRFGAPIATVANSLHVFGQEIQGDNAESDVPVSLFTFTNESVKKVIPAFLEHARRLVPESEIARYGVKAVGARKEVVTADGCGRFLGDYATVSASSLSTTWERLTNLHSALQLATVAKSECRNLANATHRIRTAILSLLQELKWPCADGVNSWRQLTIATDESSIRKANLACETLLRAPISCNTAGEWQTVLASLAVQLTALIGRPVGVNELLRCDATKFSGPIAAGAQPLGTTAIDGIDIATIASVKGETHAATLVLESFFNKRYDVADMLPFLCGEKSSVGVTHAQTLKFLHNMFVAATRPRRYLAFAIHCGRLQAQQRSQLLARGWSIVDVT